MKSLETEPKRKYLEVLTFEDSKVVKRIDVTSKSNREIELIERGMNRNMNHDLYYTSVTGSEELLTEF
ncbi:MAG TPA: hypothetical protein VGK59_18570 [Ohtaekwangia sp.]